MYKNFLLIILSILLLDADLGQCSKYQTDIGSLSTEKQQIYLTIKSSIDFWDGKYTRLCRTEKKIEKFIEQEPNFLPTYIEKARVSILKGYIGYNDHREFNNSALKIIKNIQSKAPYYPKSYVLAGHIYTNLGDYPSATESLNQAEIIGTDDPWLYNNWAELLGCEKRYTEAFENSKVALIKSKSNCKALIQAINNIVMYSNKSGIDDFDVDVNDIVFRYFESPELRLYIAKKLIGSYRGYKKQLLYAYQILSKQKELTPNLQQVDLEYANLVLASGFKYSQGFIKIYNKQACKQVLEILSSIKTTANNRERILGMRFDIAMSEKNYAKANILIMEARKANIDNIWVSSRQALCHVKGKNYKSAIHLYEEISKEEPRFKFNEALLYAYKKQGKKDKLEESYKIQVDRYPTSAWALGNYANFFLNVKHDYENAIIYGKKALEQMQYPNAMNITSLALLIKASKEFEKGNIEKSKAYYEEALAIGFSEAYINKYCRENCIGIENMTKYFDNHEV